MGGEPVEALRDMRSVRSGVMFSMTGYFFPEIVCATAGDDAPDVGFPVAAFAVRIPGPSNPRPEARNIALFQRENDGAVVGPAEGRHRGEVDARGDVDEQPPVGRQEDAVIIPAWSMGSDSSRRSRPAEMAEIGVLAGMDPAGDKTDRRVFIDIHDAADDPFARVIWFILPAGRPS